VGVFGARPRRPCTAPARTRNNAGNPHKLLQLGEIGRTKKPAMSTRAGGGPSGSLCPVFSAISSPQVLTRCGAVKPGVGSRETPVRPLVADSRSQRSHPDCPQRRSAYRPHRTASEIRCCGSCCARASGAAAHSAVTRSARCALPVGPCQVGQTHILDHRASCFGLIMVVARRWRRRWHRSNRGSRCRSDLILTF